MMIAALLFAANTAVLWEPPPQACPTPSLVNMQPVHVGLNGTCSSYGPEPCPAGIPVTFAVATSGYSFNCNVHTFTWDFGDGMTSNELTAYHSFMPGTYDVKFRLTNPYGSWTFTDRVVVEAVTGVPPAPDFLYGTELNVVYLSIDNPGLQYTHWTFDFGDGTTATIDGANPQEVVHSYAKGGTYMVILTAGADFIRARKITVTFPTRSRGARH